MATLQLAGRSGKLRTWVLCAELGALAVASGVLAGMKADAAAPSTASHATVRLPVSILDFMRAAVEIPADGIWEAQSEEKLGDDAWLLVDQDSVALASAAALIPVGGTGKKDSEWVKHADWQAWAHDLQESALAIRVAAKSKDQDKLSAEADHLQEICSSCHAKYRPEVPSDGVTRYPFYPKREMVKK